MDILIKELEFCKLSVQYTATAEEILNKRNEVLQAFKKAKVPGNRTGKASIEVIKIHYRTQIEDALKRALAEESFHNTLFEKSLKPHGPPTFTSALLSGNKFVCEFELHTKPEFELAEFAGLEVPAPHIDQNETELSEQMMQELRMRFGEVSPYTEEEFVQIGDNVIIDYEGSINGEKIDKLCAVGELLTVGASKLATFDDNILGMSLGETREFDLTVPENSLPSLSGKTIRVKVTLTMGSKTVPCALDDSLAEKMGKKDFLELKEFVRATASSAIQNKFKQHVNEAVANLLINMNNFDVPSWMSLSEAKYLAQQAKVDWAVISDEDKEAYLQLAEKNVRLSLILDKVRENHIDAQLTDQEVFEVIKANLAKTKVTQSIDEVIQQMNKSGYLQVLMQRIKDEYALDSCIKAIKIVE